MARWVNLAAPGAGQMLLGRFAVGIASLGVFSLATHAVIWSTWINPDEWPGWAATLTAATAAAVYFGSQLLVSQAIRGTTRGLESLRRRAAIAASECCLRTGDPAAALSELRPLRPENTRDLLVAVRYAQILLALRDWRGARHAWEAVRRLDRHRIYRAATDEALRTIALQDATASESHRVRALDSEAR